MLLIHQLRKTILVASPILLHVFMLVTVMIYTIFGAIIIRYFENRRIEKLNVENGFDLLNWNFNHSNKNKPEIYNKNRTNKFAIGGKEFAVLAPNVHDCVADLLARWELSEAEPSNSINDNFDGFNATQSRGNYLDSFKFSPKFNHNSCKNSQFEVENFPLIDLDLCYKEATVDYSNNDQEMEISENDFTTWTFGNSIIFTYTLITTIGYGNVVPYTLTGKIFCIIYGIIGVPLTLLTIADIGMFIGKLPKCLAERITHFIEINSNKSSDSISIEKDDQSSTNNEEDNENKTHLESILMLGFFSVYILVGAAMISSYEYEMSYFDAVYFNFISLTTIGLGDVLPQQYSYLALTFAYITVGLSLTSMTVEIAADILRRLHYFGRTVKRVEAIDVWFGGKKMKLKNLINHLGDQLNVPVDELKNLDIAQLMEGKTIRNLTNESKTDDSEVRDSKISSSDKSSMDSFIASESEPLDKSGHINESKMSSSSSNKSENDELKNEKITLSPR